MIQRNMISQKKPLGDDHDSLSMETIYNILMMEIEPELTLDMIPFLDELYAGEPEDMRKERALPYALAFEEFGERFEKAMTIWKKQIVHLRDDAIAIAAKRMNKEESIILSDLEHSIDRT